MPWFYHKKTVLGRWSPCVAYGPRPSGQSMEGRKTPVENLVEITEEEASTLTLDELCEKYGTVIETVVDTEGS